MKKSMSWMSLTFTFFLVILFHPLALTQETSEQKTLERELKDLLFLIQERASSTEGERLTQASELLLGRAFEWGPLGEGDRGVMDPGPLYRLDAFDCTTYVETALALAISFDFSSFQKNMNGIRYKDGHISYSTRNHFISADWIPNNMANGLLRDITTEIVGGEGVLAHIEGSFINKKLWHERNVETMIQEKGKVLGPLEMESLREQLMEEGKGLQNMMVDLTYIPWESIFLLKPQEEIDWSKINLLQQEIDQIIESFSRQIALESDPGKRRGLERERYKKVDALKIQQKLLQSRPNGALLERLPDGPVIANIVSPNRNFGGFVLNITHQGFIVKHSGELFFRHAALRNKIVDVPLLEYLANYLTSGAVKGIHLMALNEGLRVLENR